MNKLLSILSILLLSHCGYSQKYITKSGNLKFEASTPAFEEIAAANKSASAVLETSSGDLAVLALLKGFRFKSALMEEHFNENYVESDKYPKATFKGKIEGFDIAAITATKNYTITGELTLHGKTKKVSAIGTLSKSSGNIIVIGNFEVKPNDFGIAIPKVVRNKIAEKVTIAFNLNLSKQ